LNLIIRKKNPVLIIFFLQKKRFYIYIQDLRKLAKSHDQAHHLIAHYIINIIEIDNVDL